MNHIGPPRCECGHLELCHNISKAGARTKCLSSHGPDGTPCECGKYKQKKTRMSAEESPEKGLEGRRDLV